MQLIKLLVIAFILTTISCKKRSTDVVFKTTLINMGTSSAYSGSATATWDGLILTVHVIHNIGTVSTSADGIYNKSTGIMVGYFFAKESPFYYHSDLSYGKPADLLANLYEIRLYKGGASVLQGTLIKQ